jgi:hypothetical protein
VQFLRIKNIANARPALHRRDHLLQLASDMQRHVNEFQDVLERGTGGSQATDTEAIERAD